MIDSFCVCVAINLNPYQGLKHGQTHPWTYSVTVAINLNPYQGLKRGCTWDSCARCTVAINLNPYQGLKLRSIGRGTHPRVAINLNPYQGLKPLLHHPDRCIPSCNQPKSLSGIETFTKLSSWQKSVVAINLNPYQGLKQFCRRQDRVFCQLQST